MQLKLFVIVCKVSFECGVCGIGPSNQGDEGVGPEWPFPERPEEHR